MSERTDRKVVGYERGEVAGETTAKPGAFFGFYGSAVEQQLKRYGLALYNDFFADPRADPRHELVGRLRVATTEEDSRSLEAGAEWEGGPVARRATSRASRSMNGCCAPNSTPGRSPARATRRVWGTTGRENSPRSSLLARENGVAVETGRVVEDVLPSRGRSNPAARDCVEGIVVDGERIEAEAVVAAAGPWNPRVAAMADIDLPAHHSLAPVMVLDREPTPGSGKGTALPIVTHVKSGAYAREHGDEQVLVAHYPTERDPDAQIDPAEVGETGPQEAREEMETFLSTLLPSLVDAPEREEWVGVRSHTPDGYPIAGWTGVERFSIAAFHSSGIQLAPAVGQVVAEQLVRSNPTDLHRALSISRFDGYEDARGSIS